MQTTVIQRQYDDVIAEHYDLDPQGITGQSLDHALRQLESTAILKFQPVMPELNVLDLGMGTGMFLEKLVQTSGRNVAPFGVDLSANMAEIARQKIPELHACVDDAANFNQHFGEQSFDIICTHFITGFVPIEHLAPLIMERLAPGGFWSFVGSSKSAYPVLRRKAESTVVRMMFGGTEISLENIPCPRHENDLRTTMTNAGFEIVATDTFEPELRFRNMDEFMEYAYTGGWLTPFIEDLGLHEAGRTTRALLNTLIFPIRDHHNILLGLARKPAGN